MKSRKDENWPGKRTVSKLRIVGITDWGKPAEEEGREGGEGNETVSL